MRVESCDADESADELSTGTSSAARTVEQSRAMVRERAMVDMAGLREKFSA